MKSKEEILKEAFEKFIYTIGTVCPNGREKSVAITNVETSYLWAKESLSKSEQK
ncbi:Acb2/Tad1 domain-containing protein [Bacillus cereus]|uniref:Acb2/Tad1 domain-containing protein n=1 Tax=Bacillus cereus TaxID=1396 RepID=UPI00397BB5AA